jgi:hypothetical protein
MNEVGKRVASYLPGLGSSADDEEYENVENLKQAVQSRAYEKSSKKLAMLAKPVYPSLWEIRGPKILV